MYENTTCEKQSFEGNQIYPILGINFHLRELNVKWPKSLLGDWHGTPPQLFALGNSLIYSGFMVLLEEELMKYR